MIQSLLWQALLFLLRKLLDVGKPFIEEAVKTVIEAEALKHDDGSSYTGPEKRDYVFKHMAEFWGQQDWVSKGQRVTNLIVEAAVSYLKSIEK